MKITLRLKRNGKVIQTFKGKLHEDISYDCGEPGCPAIEQGHCGNCNISEDPMGFDYEKEAEIWRDLMVGRKPVEKSCKTCFFSTPDGSPDIGPHTTCLDCRRLSKWKRKV